MIFETARILQQIDFDIAVGSERDGNAVAEQAVGWNNPVAQIAFGGWAGTDGCFRISERSNFASIDVDGMDGSEARIEQAVSGEQLDRPATVFGEAGFHFGGLLG